MELQLVREWPHACCTEIQTCVICNCIWVLSGVHKAKKQVTAAENWMGRVEPNGDVVWVQKLQPTSYGGSTFTLIDEYFYCFAEDIRHPNLTLTKEEVRRGRRNDTDEDPLKVRWQLQREYREEICSRLPLDEDQPLRQHLNP